MTARTYTFALCCLLTSYLPDDSTSTQAQAKALVIEMFAAFNAHDPARIARLYAADAVVISPETCTPQIGRKAVAESYAKLFAELPDVQDQIDILVVEGDKIAVSFTASSAAMGFETPIASFMILKDGLVVEERVFMQVDTPPDCSHKLMDDAP